MRRSIVVALLAVLAQGALLAGNAWAHVGTGIDVDARGRVYFVDPIRDRIWRVETDARLTLLATDKHTNFLVLDEDGNAYFGDGVVWRVTPAGNLTEFLRLTEVDQGLGSLFTIDRGGNAYFLRESHLLRRTPEGGLARVVERDEVQREGKSGLERFVIARHKAWGPDGALYVTRGNSICKVLLDGSVLTLAGESEIGYADGPGGQARFERPQSAAVDAQGDVYVADSGNRRIRKITPEGQVSTVVRLRWPWMPTGVVVAASEVYVLERAGGYAGGDVRFLAALEAQLFYLLTKADLVGNPRVQKISPGGEVMTVTTVRGETRLATVGLWFLFALVVMGGLASARRLRGRREEAKGASG